MRGAFTETLRRIDDAGLDVYQYRMVMHVGILVKGYLGQSAHLQDWQDSAGNVLASISENGYLKIKKTLEPADAELDNNELVMWWDQANSKVMWKGKNSAGAVKAEELALM